jgi:hypothetical protein
MSGNTHGALTAVMGLLPRCDWELGSSPICQAFTGLSMNKTKSRWPVVRSVLVVSNGQSLNSNVAVEICQSTNPNTNLGSA